MAVSAAFFIASSALAQTGGTVSNHAVPIGKGAGQAGFTSVAPAAAGLPLVSNGASSDPSFQVLGTSAGVRQRLTGNADYYVRRDGSDSNTGLANTAGGAWLTINKALVTISNTIDFAGLNVVVHVQGANVGDGIYTENLILPDWVGYTGNGFGQFIILGENGVAKITGATATATILGVSTASPIQFKNLVLANANASGISVEADDGGFIALHTITFGSTGAGGILAEVTQSAGRLLFLAGTFTMQSGLTTGTGFLGRSGGEIIFQPGVTINYAGASTFSNAVADFASLAYFDNTGSTWSGTVPTGKTYVLSRDTLGLITFPNLITGSVSATFTPMQVPNGGTGQVSWTSGGIPCANTAVTLASSGALLANAVVYGGGAGACPSTGAAGTNGQLLLGVTGSPPAMATLSQDCTVTNAGVITCTKTNNVAFTGLATASIPLSVANGGTGDTGTAWTAFTPSLACGTATFTNNSMRSKTMGKTTWIEGDFTITAIGTCTNLITFNLPNTANSPAAFGTFENTRNLIAGCVIASIGSTGAACLLNAAGAWNVNDRIKFSGVYENQ